MATRHHSRTLNDLKYQSRSLHNAVNSNKELLGPSANRWGCRMADMKMMPGSPVAEAPASLTDCFFYYKTACNRGSACRYRHEPAALGSKTTCRFWLLGNCTKPRCAFRHMQMSATRTDVPCYFEQLPGGCRNTSCTFLHNKASQPSPADAPANSEYCFLVGL
ncbi:hypothetical protein HAZT_HAZT004937 [Hyalella azteca]|uniref:C3H1-type domain-containing protein n=1 Tax=Hyalella azteca TaxID=294128 RepID=A0A6A0GYJ2_HYAAZ|nr:hypothetical protein HAZT_HAZT004937 [Hyalella azteca]